MNDDLNRDMDVRHRRAHECAGCACTEIHKRHWGSGDRIGHTDPVVNRIGGVCLRAVHQGSGCHWIDPRRREERLSSARAGRGRWNLDNPDPVVQRRGDCVVNPIATDPVPMREVLA